MPEEVRERMKGCFVDLMGALVIGSRSRQFEAGRALRGAYTEREKSRVIGAKERFGFMGAGGRDGGIPPMRMTSTTATT